MNEVQTYLDNLTTARNRAWNEAKELLDAATKEQREFSGEEQEKWDRINADLDVKDDQIKSFRTRIETERENDVLREAIAPIVQREQREVRDGARQDPHEAVRSVFQTGGQLNIDIGLAADIKRQTRLGATPEEIRDLVKVTTTAGGYTVPVSLATQLYDFLEVYSGLRQTNVTVLTRSSGEAFDLPFIDNHGTAAIVGEGTAAAEADATFNKATLTFYKFAQLLQVSSELLSDTVVDLTGFIADDMGRALARVADTNWLTGSGTNAPTGALVKMGTATTIQTVSTGVPSYANLVDTVYSVNPLYQNRNASWLMRQAMGGAIRKLTTTTGEPIWSPNVVVGQPDNLLGFPVYYDPNMGAVGTAASTAIAFGDWSPFVIGEVGQVNLAISPDFAFSADLITYRATYRTASNLRDLSGAVKKVLEPTT